MGKRKRASSPGRELLDTVTTAGRSAIKEARRRLPPDLQQQVERNLRVMRVELARAASKADLTRLSRRIDQLAKRLDEIAREGAAGTSTRSRTRTSGSRSAGYSRRRTTASGSRRSSTTGASSRPRRTRKPPEPPASG